MVIEHIFAISCYVEHVYPFRQILHLNISVVETYHREVFPRTRRIYETGYA